MSFDKPTRNRLQSLVASCRRALQADIEDQLQSRYGMYRADERIQPIGELSALSFDDQDIAAKLRGLFSHYRAQEPDFTAAYDRLVHEIGFTSLNRLVALRLAEERGYVVECVRKALDSEGFRMYQLIVEDQLGTPFETYRFFLHLIFDEMAVDLHFLFDRSLPEGLVFPSEPVLRNVLADLTAADLIPLWKEDETIGWVYQFFNDPDERKRMREQSQAPRNSREMAVRNQFFTPRYVVEFLVDNTLGRSWIEMRQGKTGLRERCQYLLKRKSEIFLGLGEEPTADAPPADATNEQILEWPFEVPFRAEKDPRDLKILDPACGSGHFLLYSFDLLEAIYREAWNELSEQAPKSLSTGQTLREDYESLEELAKAVPELILTNNLFGVDIDPRAAQISAVALWLRAQRAYQEAGLRNLADRTRITKMNFVVAEPMPGEADLKQEFLDGLRPRVVAQVAERVFEVMKLAGEAGVLLRVEQALSGTLAVARKQWETEREVPEGLFPELAGARTKSLFDVSDIDDDAFWEIAEETILEALFRFAETAEARDPLRRRLFADDSARGLAFIDLCRTRFDVFLMNPPFGEPTSSTKPMMESEYQDAKSDVLQAFVERGSELLVPGGMLGCISNRTPFFLGGSEDFRERVVLRLFRPTVFVDLGHGVMDSAMVEAAAYTFRTLTDTERYGLVQSLAIEAGKLASEKGGAFRRSHWESHRDLKRSQAEQELRWLVGSGLLIREERATKSLITQWRPTNRSRPETIGRKDPDHIVFVNLVGEPDRGSALSNIGDAMERLYVVSSIHLALIPGSPFSYWATQPMREAYVRLKGFGEIGGRVAIGLSTKSDDRFVRLWWEVAPESLGRYNKYAPYANGSRSVIGYSSYSTVVLVKNDFEELRSYIAAKFPYLSGNVGFVLHDENGYNEPCICWPLRSLRFSPQLLPSGTVFSARTYAAIVEPKNLYSTIALLASSTVDALLKAALGQTGRPEYVTRAVRRLPYPDPAPVTDSLDLLGREIVNLGLAAAQGEETTREFTWTSDRLFDLPADDVARRSDMEGLRHYDLFAGDLAVVSEKNVTAIDALGPEVTDESPTSSSHFERSLSYLFGCVFGRWDIRGSSAPACDPVDPLPCSPPSMMQDTDGLPAKVTPPGYPLDIPWDGIVADEADRRRGDAHSFQLIPRFYRALAVQFGRQADQVEQDLCEESKAGELSEYLRKSAGFFADHLKRYSKSRRKAPIYWPLSTASGSYTLWLYYPRLTEGTLYAAVESYVRPKLAAVERERDNLESQLRNNPLASAKDLESLSSSRSLSQELTEFRDELLRIGALPYKPDLDDGVVINAAPLRKLFRYKPWVKELDEVWKKLEKGEYDWSQMAFHLWPGRVRAKCIKDRSLAVAHDLESICTAPDPTRDRAEKRGRKKKEAALIGEEEA